MEVRDIKDNMVTKSDLSELMKYFDNGISNEEILILDGEPFKADLAYQKIYKKAKKSIIVVDDYINAKTIHHLAYAKSSAKLTIISDNRNNLLSLSDYKDFQIDHPKHQIDFIKSLGRAHDRYIVLDYGEAIMKIFHCGASSKDAGKRITTITEIKDPSGYKGTIKSLMGNVPLVLK